jgi:hypothetical protein
MVFENEIMTRSASRAYFGSTTSSTGALGLLGTDAIMNFVLKSNNQGNTDSACGNYIDSNDW